MGLDFPDEDPRVDYTRTGRPVKSPTVPGCTTVLARLQMGAMGKRSRGTRRSLPVRYAKNARANTFAHGTLERGCPRRGDDGRVPILPRTRRSRRRPVRVPSASARVRHASPRITRSLALGARINHGAPRTLRVRWRPQGKKAARSPAKSLTHPARTADSTAPLYWAAKQLSYSPWCGLAEALGRHGECEAPEPGGGGYSRPSVRPR